jgi:hypothetical protein
MQAGQSGEDHLFICYGLLYTTCLKRKSNNEIISLISLRILFLSYTPNNDPGLGPKRVKAIAKGLFVSPACHVIIHLVVFWLAGSGNAMLDGKECHILHQCSNSQ